MGCNCKVTEIIIGILILVFTWWTTDYSGWIVTILAVILIIHALTCKKCGACIEPTTGKSTPVIGAVKKAVAKKRR